jgi:peptide chain release factor 3
MTPSPQGGVGVPAQAARRRTFAIISHPDAGKTTLTEKFLLYAGAVQEAGAVKSRKSARTAISDWMALEQERGISITSTVLQFAYGDWRFNLLDTPGHADFSEDTYRTLFAADAAVMVLDAAKGLEPQTLKLFRVCRDRGIPIVTFVNKCDRPGLPPLEILDQISAEIGLEPVPRTWPVADGPDFAGVVDRRTAEIVRFDRTVGGARIAAEQREPLATASPDGCPPDRWQTALEEVELLDLEHDGLDHGAFLAGKQTPVFFGSALANFGVRMLLESFAELAPAPDADGERPLDGPFSAQVFKVQANMNPRHRDRVAFLRVQTGQFRRGMTATVARSGRPFQLKYAHQLFAAERETVEDAFPGDIVGVTGASGLQVGDTLYDPDGPPITYPPIPVFAPERFARVRNRDSGRYKQFRAGIAQLDEEGVVHVLRRPEYGDQEPIFAGVGQLQFEVAAWRMANEFGAEVRIEPAPYELARRVDREHAGALQGQRGTLMVYNRVGETLVLFSNEHALRWAVEDHPQVEFAELGITRS